MCCSSPHFSTCSSSKVNMQLHLFPRVPLPRCQIISAHQRYTWLHSLVFDEIFFFFLSFFFADFCNSFASWFSIIFIAFHLCAPVPQPYHLFLPANKTTPFSLSFTTSWFEADSNSVNKLLKPLSPISAIAIRFTLVSWLLKPRNYNLNVSLKYGFKLHFTWMISQT